MSDRMKKPCAHCPFGSDVKPLLRAERGWELAQHALNPYNSFTCHKTTESTEDGERMIATESSRECAGFLTLQINEGKKCPTDFVPSELVYESYADMGYAYEDAEENHK